MKMILVRYGELTLKGKNRNQFERVLYNNIKAQLNKFQIKYKKDRSRIYLEIENDEQFDEIKEIIKKIPGISSFSIADICSHDIDEIKNLALKKFDKSNPVFKVETKRSYKLFPLNSQELSRDVGAHILINNDGLEGMKVNVKNPDQKVKIDIQENGVYIFSEVIEGMGGLPIGSSGKAVVLLSGGIDSPVAAVLAMKRGLKITCVHFSSPPYTSDKSLEKVIWILSVLHEYDKDIKMYDVNFSDLQVDIHKNCLDKYEITILRRMMIRKASEISNSLKTNVLITGESLGQVASQTINSMYATNETNDNLILRPLICMDKSEIITIAKKIGTYEISILPYEDCCVIFLPKNPSTNPNLKEVKKEEEKIEYVEKIRLSSSTIYDYDIINSNDSSLIGEFI